MLQPHGRYGLHPCHRPDLGQYRGQEVLHHRRYRGYGQRRGLSVQVRTAQHVNLLRDVRGHRQRLCQLPFVPPARGIKYYDVLERTYIMG